MFSQNSRRKLRSRDWLSCSNLVNAIGSTLGKRVLGSFLSNLVGIIVEIVLDFG